jgi:hypothetical protein
MKVSDIFLGDPTRRLPLEVRPADGEKESIKKMVTRMQKSLLKLERRDSIRTYMDDELRVMDAIERNGLIY